MKRGEIVIAKAGKEKGGAYVVVGRFDERTVLIANGRNRTIEKPKKKNVAHLQRTNTVIDEIRTNRQLREVLGSYPTGG